MNLSPQRLHAKEVEAFVSPGGSGSDDDSNKSKPKKKSRSPLEKPCTSSEEERLVRSSDEDKTENYGTFGAHSQTTPKKKSEGKPTRGSPAQPKQPTEMEGSAVHGLDVFSHEEKVSALKKLSPPVITRSRKFPPGSPPKIVIETCSETADVSEVSEADTPLAGAISKKRVEGKTKTGSKSPSKHKSPESASTSKTKVSPPKLSAMKVEARTPEKSEKRVSKSTLKSPRKAVQKCLSYLISPSKSEKERTRPRTRSQSKKIITEGESVPSTEVTTESKIETEPQPKTKKQARERSSSKSTRPADKKPLIDALDKSDSDSTPHVSPLKTSKKRDPLLPSLFGKPIEDVCDIVEKSDSDSGDVMEQGISEVASGDTGDKLLSPLGRLSTDPEVEKEQDVDFMSVSEEATEEVASRNDPSNE